MVVMLFNVTSRLRHILELMSSVVVIVLFVEDIGTWLLSCLLWLLLFAVFLSIGCFFFFAINIILCILAIVLFVMMTVSRLCLLS